MSSGLSFFLIFLMYCTILINSTHPCDCDTLDQFDTSTQVAGDHDKAKISTLNNCNKAQIGDFWEYCTISNDSSPRDFFHFSDKSPKTAKIETKLLPVSAKIGCDA